LAADYPLLTSKLREFYNFADKTVLLVGAGGGTLLDPAIQTKKLIAVDRDLSALREFERKTAAHGRQGSVEVLHGKFEEVAAHCDVVYFEFCLHEMADPFGALKHARTLAPDAVVFDHSPVSEWIFYSAEEEVVRRSAQAIKNFGIRRRSFFRTVQRFVDYPELLTKISVQGPLAIQRAGRYSAATDFVIPMFCELVLL
jgi:ubiquinone/menaquinone biosynthesis C-methylase UbiE